MINNSYNEYDLAIQNSISTLSTLFCAFNRAGGHPGVLVNQLDKPLREFLEVCIRNKIGFYYMKDTAQHNK